MDIRKFLSLAAFLFIFASCGGTEPSGENIRKKEYSKTLNTSIQSPSSIASDKRGNLYIADREKGAVEMISVFGDRVLYAQNLGLPSSITVDNSGIIYFINDENNSLLLINKNKEIKIVAENIGKSIDMTVDLYGRVSILCADQVKIFSCPPD
jgi:hypothetical protein